MRTAAVWVALLAALATANVQRSSPDVSEVTPTGAPTPIKGALEHTPSELRVLALAGLTSGQRRQLNAVSAALRAGELPQAQELWATFVTDLVEHIRANGINAQLLMTIQSVGFAAPGAGTDLAARNAALMQSVFRLPPGSLRVNSSLDPFIQYLLSDAHLSQNADLVGYVEQVSRSARPIRELLAHGYAIQAHLDVENLEVSWASAQAAEAEFLASLGKPGQTPPEGVQTPEELAECLQAWEEKLQTVGEDAQLASVNLQDVLQKQQQLVQMLSQISKLLNDTAMSVFHKVGD